MQDHEASAIGHEIGLRRRNGLEGERAVTRPGDAGFVLKPLIGVLADRFILNGETSSVFLD